MSSMECRIERLRPQQLQELRTKTPLAYLPLGILEWHGPQNPVGLDGVKAHALCLHAAQATGGGVFPTLYYGPPPATNYLDVDYFDPAISEAYGLPEENYSTNKFSFDSRVEQWHLFDRVLDQAMRQIARYGFEAILVLCGHYPLTQQQSLAISFERDFGIPVWMGHEGQNVEPPDGDHAAQWETSVTLAVEPDTVDVAAFPKAGEPNPPGVFGQPVSDVTLELAERNMRRAVDGLVSKAQELLDRRESVHKEYGH